MTADAFLRAILADPDSDSLRLQYADWLEDEGDADRSEFIRVQIALAWLRDRRDAIGRGIGHTNAARIAPLMGRERELWAAHRHDWLRWLMVVPPGVCEDAVFRRGLVESVTLSWAACVAHLDDILGRAPVTRVALASLPDADEVELDRPLNTQPPWPKMRIRGGEWVEVPPGFPTGRDQWLRALLRARWPSVREWLLPEPRATLAIDGERIDFRSVRLAEGAAGGACECRGDLPPADLTVEVVYEPEAPDRIINGRPRATHPLGIPNLAVSSGGPHPRRPPPRRQPSNPFRRR